MVSYEVTAVVRADLAGAYESYMHRHIAHVLAAGKFTAATFARSGAARYRTRYEAPDQGSLDLYLAQDASRLRADFHEHFPEGIELSRDVWDTIEVWP